MEPIPFNLRVSPHTSVAAFTVFFESGTASNLSHPGDKIGVKNFLYLGCFR